MSEMYLREQRFIYGACGLFSLSLSLYIYMYNSSVVSYIKKSRKWQHQYSEFHVFTRQSSVENCY